MKSPRYLNLARVFFRLSSAVFLLTAVAVFPNQTRADDTPSVPEFDGPKTQWHGFDRYDFVMDEKTFDIQPYDALASEGDGIQGNTPGKRRCIVVVPRQAAPGKPWSWRGCYWDHQPQTEIELLKRGFHVAYVALDPSPAWDAWYAFLTQKHGFSTKPAFVGMSKGGVNAFQWTVANPDKVGCIYADNPALYPQDFAKVGDLALHDIPLPQTCSSGMSCSARAPTLAKSCG